MALLTFRRKLASPSSGYRALPLADKIKRCHISEEYKLQLHKTSHLAKCDIRSIWEYGNDSDTKEWYVWHMSLFVAENYDYIEEWCLLGCYAVWLL
jgi:hypothetical protein